MNQNNELFRKEALDRLSSPEQLDRLMRVTSGRGWLALLAILLLVGIAGVWSVVGRVTTRIEGQGILLQRGGVHEVVSPASGPLTKLLVDVGDEIEEGAIVGRIAQPELARQLDATRRQLDEVRGQNDRLKKMGRQGVKLKRSYLATRGGSYRGSIRADRDHLAYLRKQIRRQENLLKKGLITRGRIEQTRLEAANVENRIRAAEGELRGLSVSRQELAGAKAREEISSKMLEAELEREVKMLEARLEEATRIVSPHAGRVLEIRVSEGEIVSLGRSILGLEPKVEGDRADLEALLFVPLAQGKRIRPGMEVHIAPASVRREEHGMVRAVVKSVAAFPATAAGMRRTLNNDQLVEDLVGKVGLAPLAVRAELVDDDETVSGYAWTSSDGPSLELGPGTPCVGLVLTERSRPIVRVLPMMARLFEEDDR